MRLLLPIVIFLASVAYLPGVGGGAASAGRWAVLALGSSSLLWRVRRPLLGPGHYAGIALILWATLSLLWSVSPYDTVGELIKWLFLGSLFLAASQHREPEDVLVALVVGLCLSVAFAVLQIQGNVPVLATDVPAGLFLSRNALGEVAAAALVWAVASRQWLLAPAPLMLVAVSGSRGAFLGCAVGLTLVFWNIWGNNRRWLVVSPALLFIICTIVITQNKGADLSSIYARLDIWNLAINNLTLLGRGLDTFGTLAPYYEFVHNDYIQILFELGPVGLFIAGLLLYHSFRGPITPEGTALATVAGSALVSFPLHHPMGAALVAVLSGYACGYRDRVLYAERILKCCGAIRNSSDYESHPTADICTSEGVHRFDSRFQVLAL